ncbi:MULTISPECIES: hypothetical protein [unclassified Streptomyces]|uniref:hypothetical protein n=1 Tax=unclassified Streptomyces TaxID=2593676 RepID=UPI00115FCAFB|nr:MULTISPECIES: hypothetical protein [unclassified Streptomyces]
MPPPHWLPGRRTPVVPTTSMQRYPLTAMVCVFSGGAEIMAVREVRSDKTAGGLWLLRRVRPPAAF